MSNSNMLKYTKDECSNQIDNNYCMNCDQSLSYVNEIVKCSENEKHTGCQNCMTVCLNCDNDLCIEECIDEKSRFCKKCLTYAIKKSKQEFTIENENYKICLNCNSILCLDYIGPPSCYNNSNHKQGCADCMEICKNCLKHTLCIDCSNKRFGLCKKCLNKKIREEFDIIKFNNNLYMNKLF